MTPLDRSGFDPMIGCSAEYQPPTTAQFWAAEPAQRRIFLADLLEHEAALPLRWDFATVAEDCAAAGCGLGSAERLWGAPIWAEHLGLRADDWRSIFFSFDTYGVDDMEEVRPAMVAAKLRAYGEVT
jgi:hypothetical protein